jgi:hypothetical protein
MMQQARENTGGLPREMSADVGYFSSDEVIKLTARGIDVYMPLDKSTTAKKTKTRFRPLSRALYYGNYQSLAGCGAS